MLFTILIFSFFSNCKNLTFISKCEIALDTFFEIKIQKTEDAEDILNESFSLVKNLENKLSVYNSESEISKLNKFKRYEVSEETFEIIKKAIEISQLTEGYFDITCKPIINLYKEKGKKGEIPNLDDIKRVLNRVGWNKIKFNGKFVILKNDVEIDLGGIAKGFIVDKVAEYLKRRGIKNGIVNAGGDIYCWGYNPEGKKWKIGIENPFKEGEIWKFFEITNRAIATSGNYKRYMEIKKKKIGHIVNPKNGLPVDENILIVTVIAPNCTLADGLATGIFVMGIDKGLNLVNKLEDVECLIRDKNGKVFLSLNFPKLNNYDNF